MVSVIVIGSAVRPGVASDDLDLLVLCHDVSALKEKAPIEVDLRKVSVHDVEKRIGDGHDLLTWAVRYGMVALDKDGYWAGVVARWDDRLPLPDVSVCEARAKAAWKRMENMRVIGDENAIGDLAVSYQTHRARAGLAARGIYPASRPELSGQLRTIGEFEIAADLDAALSARIGDSERSQTMA